MQSPDNRGPRVQTSGGHPGHQANDSGIFRGDAGRNGACSCGASMTTRLLTTCLLLLLPVACGDAGGEVAGGFDPAPPATGTSASSGDAGTGPVIGVDAGAPGTSDLQSCALGETRSCYSGPTGTEDVGACSAGSQSCVIDGEFGTWGPCQSETTPTAELCDNHIDDDCNGEVDEGCPEDCLETVAINISGDCVTVDCPASAPYPVGCSIDFVGKTPHGCVASTPDSATVFFKEGVVCDAGYLVGSLTCSCKPGAGLDASNCSINKANKHYKAHQSECP